MTTSAEQALRRAVYETPIIDHHARSLANPPWLGEDPLSRLMGISTESASPITFESLETLGHFRALRVLSHHIGCKQRWFNVHNILRSTHHDTTKLEAWTKTCLRSIECVLVDDTNYKSEHVEGYDKFNIHTRSSNNKRIVRIEALAEKVLATVCTRLEGPEEALGAVEKEFTEAIRASIHDPEVAALSSDICCRTGLVIPAGLEEVRGATEKERSYFCQVFARVHGVIRLSEDDLFGSTRLEEKALLDSFLHLAVNQLGQGGRPFRKPFQFHADSGENTTKLNQGSCLNLPVSSPSHLRPFIRNYRGPVRFVLLQSGYPFVRETASLAATCENVYIDVGTKFHVMDRDDQESILRRVLEVCPVTKVMWSSVGHWYPETWLLSVEMFREVLWKVLSDSLRTGDLSGGKPSTSSQVSCSTTPTGYTHLAWS